MQRIKRQPRMIRYHGRLSRDELAKDGIVARVSPVDTTENIRAVATRISTFTRYRLIFNPRKPNRHGCLLDSCEDVVDKLVPRLQLFAGTTDRDVLGQSRIKKASQLRKSFDHVSTLHMGVVSECNRKLNREGRDLSTYAPTITQEVLCGYILPPWNLAPELVSSVSV